MHLLKQKLNGAIEFEITGTIDLLLAHWQETLLIAPLNYEKPGHYLRSQITLLFLFLLLMYIKCKKFQVADNPLLCRAKRRRPPSTIIQMRFI